MAPTKTSVTQVDLSLTGMSCNACAASIEKGLNKLDGVTATVNFATESARIKIESTSILPGALIDTVTALGYGARLLADTTPEMLETENNDRVAMLLTRLTASSLLALPVVLLSMVSNLEFRNWQWLALALSAPVVTWGAWPFHRAALMNARHRSTTMDTLISIGVFASTAWSVWAIIWGAKCKCKPLPISKL